MNIARVFIIHRLPPFLVQGVWWEERDGKSIGDACMVLKVVRTDMI